MLGYNVRGSADSSLEDLVLGLQLGFTASSLTYVFSSEQVKRWGECREGIPGC